MTPAIQLLRKRKIAHTIHRYRHDASAASYGLEAANCLDVSPALVYKTLVVELDTRELAVGIVPVDQQLNTKAIAASLGYRKAVMADKADVVRSSGYVLGGVSPLGQKKRLRTVIDRSAEKLTTIYVSAGRRGLEIELAPQDLAALCDARFDDLLQH